MQLKSIVSHISRLSKRERTIFYVTIAVIGLGLLDRLILSPILGKIDHLNETITTQEETIAQSLLIVTQEKRIDSEGDLYASFLSKSQKEEKVITAFLKEVETLAKQSSVYLIDIKPSGKDTEGISKKYFLKLNFEAQMEQVINFFHNVTNYEQLIKVEGYQLGPKSKGSSVLSCGITISKAIIPE